MKQQLLFKQKEGVKAHPFKHRRYLYLALLFNWIVVASAAGASSLQVTGSGYYGLSPSEGPFARTFLSPQVIQVTPVATVRLNGNGVRNEQIGFQYRATLASEGTAAYGAFTARMSFDLQATPQTVTTMSGEQQNVGHSELQAHLNLTFNDSGLLTSSTLAAGTPVAVKFTITNRTTSFISEPEGIAPFNNPYPNGNHAGLSSGGYVTLFDENSGAQINGAIYLQNHVTVYTLNSAIGHRIDITAANSSSADGYAGYIGRVGPNLDVLFYPQVHGTLDSTTQVSIQLPAGVSFVADSGHNYTGTTISAARSDFNADDKTDYLLFNPATRRTAIWYLNGNTLLTGSYGPTLPAGWTLIWVTDFDQNGRPDYLLYNASTRQTAIWFLNNAALVSGRVGPALPPGWNVLAAVDINFDSKPDYLLFNPATRQTAVWYLNGTSYVSGVPGPTLPVGWTLIDALDFNADNKPDYLLLNPSTRQSAIWYLNGITFVSGALGPTLPPGWTLEGASDFNADGKPDYVLFQPSTRRTAIWFLNGTAYRGGAFGPTLAGGYSIVAP